MISFPGGYFVESWSFWVSMRGFGPRDFLEWDLPSVKAESLLGRTHTPDRLKHAQLVMELQVRSNLAFS